MSWKTLRDRLRARFGRSTDAELGDELRFHLEMEEAALIRAGLPAERARDEARRRLGGVDRYTEELRDVRGGRWRENLAQDARYALRVAKRFPAFTAIVVITLAFAIGASTAIFSVVNAVLLRPLPFPQPDRVAMLFSQNPDRSQPRFSVSYADYLDWRRDTHSFDGMAVIATTAPTIVGGQNAERLAGIAVSGDFFHILGMHAAIGRVLNASDDNAPGQSVVLSDGFWHRHFAANPNVVGQRIDLASGARTIVGILPPSFQLDGRPIDVVTPFDPTSIPGVENHGQHLLECIARLKPGVTLAQAQQELTAVASRLAGEFQQIAGWSANVFLLQAEITRNVKRPLIVLLAAALLVLLIGCINVANLLVTRSAARSREVAMRRALGASRGRLVTQLLVESAVLSFAGAMLGIGVAIAGTRALLRYAPPGLLPSASDVGIDARVLAFALGLAVLTAVAVGLWPALRASSPRLTGALRDGGRGSAGGTHSPRMRRALVIVETSLALVLLVCSLLVLQSLRHMLDVNPGYRVDHLLVMRVAPGASYRDTTLVAFYRDVTTRLAGRAGIEAVAASNVPPLSVGGIATPVRIIGRAVTGSAPIMSAVTAITPGFFRTTGIALLRGRDVAWSDVHPMLLVNRAAAAKFWPNEDPIGKRVGFGQRDTLGLEVVGIVADVRARSLTDDPIPMIYMGYQGATNVARSMTLIMRGRGDEASLAATSRAVLREIDPRIPPYNVQSMRAIVDLFVAQPRLNSLLLGVFAAMALLLAAIGIYGVVSFSVAQRTQEIGVRMALGAQERDVFRLILREGAVLALIGVATGIVLSFAATNVIQSWLYGIDRRDVTTFGATAAALIAIAITASYIPARRAAAVDPLLAMRAE
jgi:predicted permease